MAVMASCVRENFRSHTAESGTQCPPFTRVVMLAKQFAAIPITLLVTVNKVFTSSHLTVDLFTVASDAVDCLARAPMGCSCGISSSESISPSDSVDLSEDSESSSR